tara:strand:- start:2609 stop:4915 length:2307 start_codon:yes stop_codon:yes gene_type:complete
LIVVLLANITTVCFAQITPNSKWLSKDIDSEPLSPEVNDFLKVLNGQMRLLHCKYDQSDLSHIENLNNGDVKIGEQIWQAIVKVGQMDSDKSALDIDVGFKLKSGNAKDVGVAVAFDFNKWNNDNYVLVPASVYDGNRVRIVDREYAQGLDRNDLYKKDLPLTSTPIPHLSRKINDISKIELNASNAATPAMCFLDKKSKYGFIVLSQQNTEFGNNGFMIQESADRTQASFVITAPGVRDKRPVFVGFAESLDRGATITTGTSINLKCRVYVFKAKDIPELLNKFMSVRKAITGPNSPRNLIPFSQFKSYMTQRIDERYYKDSINEFYYPENAKWISFGWIGGLMNTFPMIALNDDSHLKKVSKTFDFAIPSGQGKTGYFYGTLNYDGKPFGREGYDENSKIALTRKSADVLYWMIKQFKLLKVQGKEDAIKLIWENQIKKLADAFVKTWKENHQWGNFINNETGEIVVFNTSSGVMAIGGLALASEYYNNPEYLEVAKKAADYYYDLFEKQGKTTGGCADILQNADSETAAGFMTALMALYEVTHNKKWLEASRNLANLVATWTTSYDYQLPENTELAKNGAKLAGAYWASTQNKHSAPGICTSSGDPLFKIYRATGNMLYADLLNDIVHAYGESIRPGGFTNERLTYCDAEPFSVGNRGNHITGWNELNGFLMSLEIPGIYITTDAKRFYVFDSVEAEIIDKNTLGITLKITNTTQFDAKVSVLAESSDQSHEPLGYVSFVNWPQVHIGSGQTKIVKIGVNGDIAF